MKINLNEEQLNLIMKALGYNPDGELTSLGRHILEEVENLKKVGFEETFRELFPSVKLPSGKYFKSNLNDIKAKIKTFRKFWDYDEDVILEATRKYISYAESVDYKFVRTASYFILKKGEGSDLADWCEKVIHEEFEEKDTEPLQKFI